LETHKKLTKNGFRPERNVFMKQPFSTASARVYLRAVLAAILTLLLLTSCEFPDILSRFNSEPEATEVAGEAAPSTEEIEQEEKRKENTPTVEVKPTMDLGEITGADADGSAEALSGLVLFTSTAGDPFADFDYGAVQLDHPERHLWAISVDGKRGGRLSPEGFGTALVSAKGGLQYVAQGFEAIGDPFVPVALPNECAETASESYDPDHPPCGDFQFTLEGRFMAYLHGPLSCGRDLTLRDALNGNVLKTWNGVHWYYILKDGSLVINMGGCDKSVTYNYAPKTDRQGNLGLGGTAYWNPARTAVIWLMQATLQIKTGMLGLNFETSRIFARLPDDAAIENSPAWTADSEHFLFNRRVFRVDASSKAFVLEGPRQILAMSSSTRKQKLLAYSPSYNYHLCESAGEPCREWSGDWIEVYRTPFRKVTLRATELDSSTARCALYGLECETPAERFALNWRTGELLPWDEAGLDDPIPLLEIAAPDLDGQPVYQEPNNDFALLTSPGGRSLWYVPYDGEPRLLVSEGENFVYIP
jgi:hypothetical protein